MSVLLMALSWGKSLLTFFSKPPGVYIGIAIAFVLSLWWFGQHEFNRGKAVCESAHAEASAQELARQKAVVVTVNKASDVRTGQAKQLNTDNQKVIVYVHDKAAALPTASDECVPADLADSLRGMR